MADVDSYFAEHSDPAVVELWRRWKRNRALFDETDGMAVGRETEFALRFETEKARQQLEETDDAWRQRGLPHRGRIARRWQKRRLEFLKAIDAENSEYESTLRYRNLDPSDDEAIDAFLIDVRQED
jgi:hypothetical protein